MFQSQRVITHCRACWPVALAFASLTTCGSHGSSVDATPDSPPGPMVTVQTGEPPALVAFRDEASSATILTALGYRAENHGALRLFGPDVELEIRQVPGGQDRLVELGLRLGRPHTDAPKIYQLGSSSQLLLFPAGQPHAVWNFGIPSADSSEAVS